MGILVQKPEVLLRAIELMHVDPPLDAPANRVRLVGREIVSRPGAQQHIDLLHRLRKPRFAQRLRCHQREVRPLRVGPQLRRYLLDRQHVIHRPVAMALLGMPEYLADSGAWAIVIPAAPLMALSPSVPSVPVPERTIPMAFVFFFLVLGQRAKEIINGQAQRPGFVRLHQVQRAVEDRQVALGGRHVDAAGLDRDAIRCHPHAHPGAFAQQLRQQAGM